MAGTGDKTIGIIMNGVTGRMGTNQHLVRSILAIRDQGGVKIGDGQFVMPQPVLVGRNLAKLEKLAREHGVTAFTDNLEKALADKHNVIYFDAQATNLRAPAVKQAIAAGKHIYCEKPSGVNAQEAYSLYQLARQAGVKHGAVQDKLFLPGLQKLRLLLDSGFFGDVFSVRGEFGYWVFQGADAVVPQRPSWNYRKEDGGGIMLDMMCHWSYLLENLFGRVKSVSCLGATHVPQRWDESGTPYVCTADDSAYATFKLEKNIVAHFNSSWTVRVRRDDLLTLQVDGSKGSAVAGLRKCFIQPYGATPRPVWNPDIDSPINFLDSWQEMPAQQTFDNAFKQQWEQFIAHVAADRPYAFGLREAARAVQLAEISMRSSAERRWIDLPELPE